MMLDMDINQAGRRRVAELVRAAMAWSRMSGPSIEQTGRVSRATIDRIKRGDANVSDTMLRAAGDVLGLPRDFLLYVGAGNVRAIRAVAPPDLAEWVMLNLFTESDHGESGGDASTHQPANAEQNH